MPTSELWTKADGDWYSMFAILVNVAGFTDGNLLKCDLATLLMGSIFKLTWGCWIQHLTDVWLF